MSRHRRTNTHHILPRSRGGQGGDNLVELDTRVHAILHDVFGNATPREYLIACSTPEGADRVLGRLVRAISHFLGRSFVLHHLDRD